MQYISYPDLSLLVGPQDRTWFPESSRQGGALAPRRILVVHHRRARPWTSVYRIVNGQRPDYLRIKVVLALDGERFDEAITWVRETLNQC